MWNLLSLDPKSSYSSAYKGKKSCFFWHAWKKTIHVLVCSRVQNPNGTQNLVLLAGDFNQQKWKISKSTVYSIHEYQQMWTTPLTSSILISHQNYFRNETRPSSSSKRSQVSHEKNLLLSIESWLFNRDPFKGLLRSPYNCVLLIPNKSPTKNNQVFFFIAQVKKLDGWKGGFPPGSDLRWERLALHAGLVSVTSLKVPWNKNPATRHCLPNGSTTKQNHLHHPSPKKEGTQRWTIAFSWSLTLDWLRWCRWKKSFACGDVSKWEALNVQEPPLWIMAVKRQRQTIGIVAGPPTLIFQTPPLFAESQEGRL